MAVGWGRSVDENGIARAAENFVLNRKLGSGFLLALMRMSAVLCYDGTKTCPVYNVDIVLPP
jgi:hypothetical protein